LAGRQRHQFCRRGQRPAAMDHLPRCRHLPARGEAGPAVSAELADAARHRLRKHAKRLDTDPGQDFDAEVRAYFGTGTQLQEMYISHDRLDAAAWDVLAEAARWARGHAATLVDTHWIGGDPGQLAVYGHAAWSPRKAILTLRNPSDKPQTIEIDPAQAFELPAGARPRMRMSSPWKNDQWRQPQAASAVNLEAGRKQAVALKPFEVLTLETQ